MTYKWSIEECAEYVQKCKEHAAELGGDARFEQLYDYARSLESELAAYRSAGASATVSNIMSLAQNWATAFGDGSSYDVMTAYNKLRTAIVAKSQRAEAVVAAARKTYEYLDTHRWHNGNIGDDLGNALDAYDEGAVTEKTEEQ